MTFNDKGMPPHAYKQQGCDKSPNTLVTPFQLSILSLSKIFLIPQSKIVNHFRNSFYILVSQRWPRWQTQPDLE